MAGDSGGTNGRNRGYQCRNASGRRLPEHGQPDLEQTVGCRRLQAKRLFLGRAPGPPAQGLNWQVVNVRGLAFQTSGRAE
jgi:hypothetical protein